MHTDEPCIDETNGHAIDEGHDESPSRASIGTPYIRDDDDGVDDEDFDAWINQFQTTLNTASSFVDWNRISINVNKYRKSVLLMERLLDSDDEHIDDDFRQLASGNPEVLPGIPILIAMHAKTVNVYDSTSDGDLFKNHVRTLDFAHPDTDDIEQYVSFMRSSGLFSHLMELKRMKDHPLLCNMIGIETGLDSNARKNRNGHVMEDLIENKLKDYGVEYHKEMTVAEIESRYGLDLSPLSAHDGVSSSGVFNKRFDFVVFSKGMVYAIEVNFYNGGGSKLNETARSYELMFRKSMEVQGEFKFLWITDGAGWRTCRNALRSTYAEAGNRIISLNEVRDGFLGELFDEPYPYPSD